MKFKNGKLGNEKEKTKKERFKIWNKIIHVWFSAIRNNKIFWW